MTELRAEDFARFFEAVHGREPFPWQQMLVARVLERGWPPGVALPTASGKTACMDVAVFTLALTADRPPDRRPTPRRIFFVVDRRIVVDAAYDRAKRLADALASSRNDVVRAVADRLRSLVGNPASAAPLVTARIRGGAARDLEWRLDPRQPAIITGTVDQIGSRMLFRGYGVSRRAASVDAALTVCDSLVLLDEAHCAVPFLETARAVSRYAGAEWSERQVAPPFRFSILSATPPPEIGSDIFPTSAERTAALDHAELRRRIVSPKRARLEVASPPPARVWTLGRRLFDDELVQAAAQWAADFLGHGHKRIAVMVNRVRTAAQIARQLEHGLPAGAADVVLLTGRIRPADRDAIIGAWSGWLQASETPPEPDRPVIVVTTQCLEVGADFSFEALVTECAALDALRQRLGRLDRLGRWYAERPDAVPAVILIRKPDTKIPTDKQIREGEVDPVYGAALARTWQWLSEQADEKIVDFGIGALDARLPTDPEARAQLLEQLTTPSERAPVLLPAHLDLLVQTAPRPAADPDPAVFLHGPGRGRAEARLVLRADLDPEAIDTWGDTLALIPPTSAEALTVPLHLLRRWLLGRAVGEDPTSDVEGESPVERAARGPAPGRARRVPFVVWRGRRRTRGGVRQDDPEFRRHIRSIKPDETVVVPVDLEAVARLGHLFQTPAPPQPEPVEEADRSGSTAPESRATPRRVMLDAAERAYRSGRAQHLLRIHPLLLEPWRAFEPVASLLQWAADTTPEKEDLPGLLRTIVDRAADAHPPLPDWLVDSMAEAAGDLTGWRLWPYPQGRGEVPGWLLLGPPSTAAAADDEEFADEDDTRSDARTRVLLADHLHQVAVEAERFGAACLGADWGPILREAGLLHDIGKADERFQAMLHGSEVAALAAEQPLAKSPTLIRQPRNRERLRATVGLPRRFRHELLSTELAQASGWLSGRPDDADLILHLVASHHGHARPFAPTCEDRTPPTVEVVLDDGRTARLPGEVRRSVVPAHSVASGVAERFWRLTRRYGWWGLAYLEAVFRLADWAASQPDGTQGRKAAR